MLLSLKAGMTPRKNVWKDVTRSALIIIVSYMMP